MWTRGSAGLAAAAATRLSARRTVTAASPRLAAAAHRPQLLLSAARSASAPFRPPVRFGSTLPAITVMADAGLDLKQHAIPLATPVQPLQCRVR